MWTLYIFSKHPKGFLHVGYSASIKKAETMYNSLPVIKEKNKLYYIEVHEDENVIKDRFDLFMAAPRHEVIQVIEKQNPEWVELIIGVNILV